MARTIKNIRPDGGGDYTNLDDAWTALKIVADWGDGYDWVLWPGASNCGDVQISGATHIPASDSNLRIYAAPGHGVKDASWRRPDQVATTGTVIIREAFTHLGAISGVGEGFQLDGDVIHPLQLDTAGNPGGASAKGFVMDSCFLKTTAPDSQSGVSVRCWQSVNSATPTEITFRNSIFLVTGSLEGWLTDNAIISFGTTDATTNQQMTLNLDNCLLVTDSPNVAGGKVYQGLKIFNFHATGTIVMVAKNNVLIGVDFDDAYNEGAIGIYTTSGDFNADQDGTMNTLLGGSNNIANLVTADEFRGIANGDFRIEKGAQIYNAGDLTTALDMRGVTRDADHKSIGPLNQLRIPLSANGPASRGSRRRQWLLRGGN